MANWFKEEINHFGAVVDTSIQKASLEIQNHIDRVGSEINNQRNLTKNDIENLIDYAAQKFGNALDERIEKAKAETASLVTEKIAEIRQQLTDATNEQKRVAVRNATVAVSAAIIIGVISLLYRKLFQGELDLLTVFRAILLSFACGHGIWILSKYITEYLQSSRTKKNVILIGAQYFGVFRLKGAIGHVLLFIAIVALWALLNFWPQLKLLLNQVL